MGIYMGGTKCKLVTNGSNWGLTALPYIIITNGIRILSCDGYTLTDNRRVFPTINDDENYNATLLSLDDYILNDTDELNLTVYDFEDSDMQMSTLDDYILQDTDNLYITTRKG
jgi:hypothetical protein